MKKITFPHLTFIFDRYKKASLTHKASIELRITFNGKQKYISTGIRVYPQQWDGNIVIGTPDAPQLNQQLDQFLIDVRQILVDMQKQHSINIFEVPARLEGLRKRNISLYDFIRQRMEIKKYGKAKDTKERYERFFKLFKQYGKIKSFEDITDVNIIMYDEYLHSKGMKDYSKWQNYHRFLNSFIIDAIDEGYIKRNPYKWLNIEKDKSSKGLQRCLTPEEFDRLKKVKLSTVSLEQVRDLFVFQTYTCLSYIELKNFNPSKIITIKGMKVYTGKRDKTGKEFTIPLLKEPLKILHKYNNVLPIISNVKYNLYLKTIAQAAGIDKPVSTHYARHTGATFLLNSGVPMQIVSKICGHSSTKITEQVYAKLLDETVVEAIKKLKNKKPPTKEG